MSGTFRNYQIFILLGWITAMVGFVLYVPFSEYFFLDGDYQKVIEVKYYAWSFWAQDPAEGIRRVLRINYKLIILKMFIVSVITLFLIATPGKFPTKQR